MVTDESIYRRIILCPMPQPNDANAGTVGEFLAILLRKLWQEEQAFSGKRPFGNSSWQWEVYEALVREGLVAGTLDSDGYLDDDGRFDGGSADALIEKAISLIPTLWGAEGLGS